MTDDLIAFLRARLAEDERVAREASRSNHGDGFTPTGEHWHWVEAEHDQVLTLDPMLDEYVNDGSQAALRSVEEYPTNMPYTLPHFVVSYAEETRTVDAMHIARWDPARVLAEVEAKRRILDEAEQYSPELESGDNGAWALSTVLCLLALPFADHPHYRRAWRPDAA